MQGKAEKVDATLRECIDITDRPVIHLKGTAELWKTAVPAYPQGQ